MESTIQEKEPGPQIQSQYRATYSPEDNKLRLYSETRLDSETYAKVRAHGFIWASVQKLFVAPAWAPDREDLLFELCGTIEDEDTSLAERAEERAERFNEYSDSRAKEAENAKEAVSAIADNIPLGQPILVGHHSERHARRDQEKIENGMRKAVKLWETSRYWEDRAKGAIRNAKYKERPEVRARRIKNLEADKRKFEKMLDFSEIEFKLWSKENLTLEQAKYIANRAQYGGQITLANGTKEWSAWSALEHNEISLDECRKQVLENLLRTGQYANRWIEHLTNRLTYEKILYGESGGIASDRVKPEKGGACTHWASRGYWTYIQKVNRISVTVLDTWGRDDIPEELQKTFTRTIPFDQLKAVLSKADVEEKRKSGELLERKDKIGFFLKKPVEDIRTPHLVTKSAEDQEFEKIRESLKQGVQVISAPQLFPTPPDLASRMVSIAGISDGETVLEPSAGTGNLVYQIQGCGKYVSKLLAIEINPALAESLRQRFKIQVQCEDFLRASITERFDKIIMNPPFENGEDIKHILHARTLLKENGYLIALCANGPRQIEQLKPLCEFWEDLPEDTFKEQGTGVRVALLAMKSTE